MIKETLKVTGMHCPKCTARVEKTVGAIDGVESVAADFEATRWSSRTTASLPRSPP
ncbi:MAG TPA: heavy-metal-associated domain-containing protein [Eggerthellaceae bacterium]|nr:heavy-metal-associated domain-containing protein [Eggerthellaceae bacterium]